MSKYHMKEDGNLGSCTATVKSCPLGEGTIHGDSPDEVYAQYEKMMSEKTLPENTSKGSEAVEMLSAEEAALLGTERLSKNGKPSTIPWPSKEQWPELRKLLVANSVKSNPKLDPKFTAYTPGETVKLMEMEEIEAWHERARNYRVPEGKTVVFVPCAKTKPWDRESSGKSSYYSSYHKLMDENPDLYFVTISEPLGLVSMDDWSDFQQYDNPGLFKDPAQRSSMLRSDWLKNGYDSALATPFDEDAYDQSIDKLSSVIAPFLENHRGHEMISLVDSREGEPLTTHGDMLNRALEASPTEVKRFAKRGEARVSPLPYLQQILADNLK